MLKKLMIAAMACSMVACSSGNLDNVKDNAVEVFKNIDYEVVGYEGFHWGFWGFNSYGGAKVWYRLDKIPDNGISYTGYIQQWGDEFHIYGPWATDAIKP